MEPIIEFVFRHFLGNDYGGMERKHIFGGFKFENNFKKVAIINFSYYSTLCPKRGSYIEKNHLRLPDLPAIRVPVSAAALCLTAGTNVVV